MSADRPHNISFQETIPVILLAEPPLQAEIKIKSSMMLSFALLGRERNVSTFHPC